MSSISDGVNTYSFDSMRGVIREVGENVREITRTGVDGHEYIKQGKRGPVFTVTTAIGATSIANANTALRNYEAMKGVVVTVVDDFAISRTNFIVLDVQGRIQVAPSLVGGSVNDATHLVLATWTLQDTGI